MSCPRCHGFLYTDHGETKCLCCGWYHVTPLAPPIEVEPARRWESVMCERCENSAVRGHALCRSCWQKPGPKMALDSDEGTS